MATSTHGSRSTTFKYNETTTAPTVNDDGTAGYAIGSEWWDTTADRAWVCVDTSTGAAVWKEISTSTDYVATSGDTAINSLTDVAVASRAVPNLVAGNILVVDCDFTIVNDSGGSRAYVLTFDFDGLFDVETTTHALAAGASTGHVFQARAVLDIRSTSLSYMTVMISACDGTGSASGGDMTMVTNLHRSLGWGTSATDATGTTTASFNVRSDSATATQTARIHRFQVTKLKG